MALLYNTFDSCWPSAWTIKSVDPPSMFGTRLAMLGETEIIVWDFVTGDLARWRSMSRCTLSTTLHCVYAVAHEVVIQWELPPMSNLADAANPLLGHDPCATYTIIFSPDTGSAIDFEDDDEASIYYRTTSCPPNSWNQNPDSQFLIVLRENDLAVDKMETFLQKSASTHSNARLKEKIFPTRIRRDLSSPARGSSVDILSAPTISDRNLLFASFPVGEDVGKVYVYVAPEDPSQDITETILRWPSDRAGRISLSSFCPVTGRLCLLMGGDVLILDSL
ncbi:hypothetical protein CPB83DRAFT_893550 [Crepidotus variabilis]|uniref:Uncharacterized protein n=1 Tax=Crepidotus variabilis TaxID=179855 RepID=A0A9P6JRD7_9AGAR|nr:hypothetical protein CPB83DRAFT_893550 [Crepidotus variabilis]